MRKGVNVLAKAIPIVQAILPETSWVLLGKIQPEMIRIYQ